MSEVKKKIEEIHWLVRPETIRKLWRGSCILLAILVLTDLLVEPHPYFGIDGSFGFYAWYGFFTCAAMVIGAKALSALVKRDDTYYEDTRQGDDDNA